MKMKIKNSPSSSSCNNDISPPQSPPLFLDSTQLDQLSNDLRMMSIDDESINKVLEKLKTLKNESQPFDIEAVVEPNGLLPFVLFRFLPQNMEREKDILSVIKGYQQIIKLNLTVMKNCNNENQFAVLFNENVYYRGLLIQMQDRLPPIQNAENNQQLRNINGIGRGQQPIAMGGVGNQGFVMGGVGGQQPIGVRGQQHIGVGVDGQQPVGIGVGGNQGFVMGGVGGQQPIGVRGQQPVGVGVDGQQPVGIGVGGQQHIGVGVGGQQPIGVGGQQPIAMGGVGNQGFVVGGVGGQHVGIAQQPMHGQFGNQGTQY